MKIGIVGYRGEYGFEKLFEASRDFGEPVHFNPDFMNFDSLRGLPVPEVDLLIVRDLGGETLEERAFRMDLLHLLSSSLPVFNSPEAINTAGNKFLTYFKLLKKGIPIPRTILGRDLRFSFDTVTKPIFGYQGKGIKFHETGEILRGFHLAQEFLRGDEFRVFVIGDSSFGAIKKFPREGEWRANLSLGAKMISVRVEEEIEEIAIKASKTLGCLFSAVDLMVTSSGVKVLEVNATPNFRSFPGAEKNIVKACIDQVI